MSSSNAELSQAALQALGFCVYHSRVISGVPGIFIYIWPHFTHDLTTYEILLDNTDFFFFVFLI